MPNENRIWRFDNPIARWKKSNHNNRCNHFFPLNFTNDECLDLFLLIAIVDIFFPPELFAFTFRYDLYIYIFFENCKMIQKHRHEHPRTKKHVRTMCVCLRARAHALNNNSQTKCFDTFNAINFFHHWQIISRLRAANVITACVALKWASKRFESKPMKHSPAIVGKTIGSNVVAFW